MILLRTSRGYTYRFVVSSTKLTVDKARPCVNLSLMKIPRQKCQTCNGSGRTAIQDNLGLLMRAEREKREVSLRKVAGIMGKSPAFISQLENGIAVWSNSNLARYFQALRLASKSRTAKVS